MRTLYAAPLLALAWATACSTPRSMARSWGSKVVGTGISQKTVQAMDVPFRVTVWAGDNQRVTPDAALAAAEAEIQRVATMVSPTHRLSELRQVNLEAPRKPSVVSPEFFSLLTQAKAMWERSSGNFRVTRAEGDGAPMVDEGAELDLTLDDRLHTVRFKDFQTRLDLHGIARGYAAQKAAEKLGALGLGGFSISVGGFLAAAGEALQDPRLMCLENPRRKGTCGARIEAMDPARVLYLGTAGRDGGVVLS
ncbi:MAG TPA: FAD:protein FMN transferase, partial [Bdellovibrionota bacterium]|nr:FAD:protein FMN transferase [Bdellovibrionota bacterium]